jgi:beta-lactamase regulating signal transducer with metallopeptidase domain
MWIIGFIIPATFIISGITILTNLFNEKENVSPTIKTTTIALSTTITAVVPITTKTTVRAVTKTTGIF